jgi:hypothetical protein
MLSILELVCVRIGDEYLSFHVGLQNERIVLVECDDTTFQVVLTLAKHVLPIHVYSNSPIFRNAIKETLNKC